MHTFAPSNQLKFYIIMAKNVGLIGSLQGKLGNAVFYVSNGVQVSRVYQPVVANPNTSLQIAQRAKMALAGRLSKITPIVALAGLGGDNKRIRRGEFVKELIRASTYSNNKAAVSFANLSLSHGGLQLLTTQSVTRQDSAVYIRLMFSVSRSVDYSSLPVGYGLRAVVYFIDNTNSGSDFCRTEILSLPSGSTAVTTTIQAVVTRGTTANYTPVVYIIPFQATESLDGVNYSFVGDEEQTYILVDSLKSVAKLSYGDSFYLPISAS